jgi:hypothetical protein
LQNLVLIRSHPPALLIPPEQGGTGFWKMAYAFWSGTVDGEERVAIVRWEFSEAALWPGI